MGIFEEEAARRGALTFTLGTDDDAGMTSLGGADLYVDLPRQIAELRDLGRGHPFLFYRTLEYVVTGVVPDANGRGRPDIYMSKRAGRRAAESGVSAPRAARVRLQEEDAARAAGRRACAEISAASGPPRPPPGTSCRG